MTWLFTACALTLGFACGSAVGFRAGRNRTWLLAALAVAWSTRAVHLQLAHAERALAEQGEIRHAAVVGPDLWPSNGVGYRSATPYDSPAASGAGPSIKETNDHAKAG